MRGGARLSGLANARRLWATSSPTPAATDALISSLFLELPPRAAAAEARALLRAARGKRRALLAERALAWAVPHAGRGEPGARELLAAWSRLDPRDPEPRLAAGIAEGLAGRWDAAARRYREAARATPDDPRPALYLAERELRAGRWRRALAILRAALARLPRRAPSGDRALIHAYRLAAGAHDFERAAALGEALAARAVRRRALAHHACWIPLVDDFELFARPRPYLADAKRALDRFAARAPRSPWPAFFRVLLLAPTMSDPLKTGVDEDCARLRRMDLRGKEWMLAPVALRERATGRRAAARADERRAARAGAPLAGRGMSRKA